MSNSRLPDVEPILRAHPYIWRLLKLVSDLGRPDCWIAAGVIRNAVWDTLHGRTPVAPRGDVDVIWFDPFRSETVHDREMEEALRVIEPSIAWSVKNQARMHLRNGDDPYRSATDAMRYWPETATAIAVRRIGVDQMEMACPFGLDDLLNLVLRPTPRFADEKRSIFEQRLRSKAWLESWPLLVRAEPAAHQEFRPPNA